MGWNQQEVLRILRKNDRGMETLAAIAAEQIVIYQASRIRYWWAHAALVANPRLPDLFPNTEGAIRGEGSSSPWQPAEPWGILMPDRDGQGKVIRPASWVILIHAQMNDLMAALTVVHEVTHWQGGDELAARRSEVEFLSGSPELLCPERLGGDWYARYLEWLTQQGDGWLITGANEEALRDYVAGLGGGGPFVYGQNQEGDVWYDLGNRIAYPPEAWR
jgi:hypothetical protein